MSAFTQQAAMRVAALPKDSPERVILVFLLKHGQGRHRAQPWVMIEQALNDEGIAMSKDKFQQTILADSRDKTGVFIAANDKHPFSGYYLIEGAEDAEDMIEWYRSRERAYSRRRAILEGLARSARLSNTRTRPAHA